MTKTTPIKKDRDKTKYYTALRRRMEALAAREQMRTQTMRGELVERRVVDNQAFRQARECRDQLNNIADRISGIVAAEMEQAKVHAIITKEINLCLEALTNEQKTDPTPQPRADSARPRPARSGATRHAHRVVRQA